MAAYFIQYLITLLILIKKLQKKEKFFCNFHLQNLITLLILITMQKKEILFCNFHLQNLITLLILIIKLKKEEFCCKLHLDDYEAEERERRLIFGMSASCMDIDVFLDLFPPGVLAVLDLLLPSLLDLFD